MIEPLNDKEILQKIMNDRALRVSLCKKSHQWFFPIYFSNYIKYELAPFHKEFLALTEDETLKFCVVSAFRGSGKSTIFTTSFSLWAIFGVLKKRNVLIISQTQAQAKAHLKSIIDELQYNPILRNDLGPFSENNDQWNSSGIVFSNTGAKITAVSLEQSIRGIRFREHRPDLIINDDIEDENSVRTKESRDKTFNLLTGEIIPTGDLNTSVWIIGNLLHEDSVIARLEENMRGKENFKSLRIPIVDDKGNPMWPGKFTTKESIEKFRLSVPNPAMWMREYLLKIVRSDEKVIYPEWIKKWEQIPTKDRSDYRYTIISVDPAMSEKESGDFTAIITAHVFGYGDKIKIYILPVIFNEKFSSQAMIQKIKDIYKVYGKRDHTVVCIESVGFQELLVNQFENNFGEYVETVGVKVGGHDKRSRLVLASGSIEKGEVLFPPTNSNELIRQLLDFPIVKHDDLVDALSMLINHVNQDRGVEEGVGGCLLVIR